MPKHVLSRKKAYGFTDGQVTRIADTWKEAWEFSDDEDIVQKEYSHLIAAQQDIPKEHATVRHGRPASGAPARISGTADMYGSPVTGVEIMPQPRKPVPRQKINLFEIVKNSA